MRKAVAAGLCAVLAVLLLAGCGERAALDRLAAGERGRVAQVRSADVLVLDGGLVVRLAGLDAPRTGEAGADQGQALLTRLALGRRAQLLYGGVRRDAYGRALAQVRLADGNWLQKDLLEAGLARVRTWPDNRAMAAPMLAAEARARARRRGLWNGVWQVRLPEEMGPGAGGFQIVEGWVRGVTPKPWGVYLEFSRDAKGFAALVPAAHASDFAAAGRDPAGLQRRLIRVRGVVGWDGVMTLDHPEAVELLRAP